MWLVRQHDGLPPRHTQVVDVDGLALICNLTS